MKLANMLPPSEGLVAKPRARRRLTPQEIMAGWEADLGKRFMSNVIKSESTGCWNWRGRKSYNGYGVFAIGTNDFSHRVSYMAVNGKIPDGLEVDHLCRNRLCCNPVHLEAITHRENVLRGKGRASENAKKTHCPNGHPYSEENTYRYGNNRMCKTCVNKRAEARNKKIMRSPKLRAMRNQKALDKYHLGRQHAAS